MPHNRAEKEKEIRDRYEFVVFDGEWSSAHAILAVIDAFYTGGSVTWEVVKSEMQEIFGNVSQAMIEHGLDPLNEPIYVDKMIFQNWEREFGIKLKLPNKFVPYVAARKKSDKAQPPEVESWSYWLLKGSRCLLYDHEKKSVIWNMQMDNSKGFPDAWTDLDAVMIS